MNMEVDKEDKGAHINRVHPDPKHVVDGCFDLQPDLLYNILYDDMEYTIHFTMNISYNRIYVEYVRYMLVM